MLLLKLSSAFLLFKNSHVKIVVFEEKKMEKSCTLFRKIYLYVKITTNHVFNTLYARL